MEKREADLKKAFSVFEDSPGSGRVSVADLKRALTSLGDKLTIDEVRSAAAPHRSVR